MFASTRTWLRKSAAVALVVTASLTAAGVSTVTSPETANAATVLSTSTVQSQTHHDAKASVSKAHKAKKSECQLNVKHPNWCPNVEADGHRGQEGPKDSTNEDSRCAFLAVSNLGGDVGIEADQWNLASNDGTYSAGAAVVNHDQTVDRVATAASMVQAKVTPGTRIGDITLAQWKILRHKGGCPFMTVAQMIKFSGKHHERVMSEIKFKPNNPQYLVNLVNKYHAPMSFYGTPHYYVNGKGDGVCDYSGVLSMQALGMPAGIKMDNPKCQPDLQTIHNMGYSTVITGADATNASYVKQAHALTTKVGCYDSGSVAEWAQLVNARADIIIAPHPGKLEKWLTGHR